MAKLTETVTVTADDRSAFLLYRVGVAVINLTVGIAVMRNKEEEMYQIRELIVTF